MTCLILRSKLLIELLKWLLKFLINLTYSNWILQKKKCTFRVLGITIMSCLLIFLINFSFTFINLQLRPHYQFFVQWKKSYLFLICRVAKNPPVLELLNHCSKLVQLLINELVIKKSCIQTDFSLPKLHFRPMFSFYTSWNRQKTSGFLTFSGGIEREHLPEMG